MIFAVCRRKKREQHTVVAVVVAVVVAAVGVPPMTVDCARVPNDTSQHCGGSVMSSAWRVGRHWRARGHTVTEEAAPKHAMRGCVFVGLLVGVFCSCVTDCAWAGNT